jgi:magnesium transporter
VEVGSKAGALRQMLLELLEHPQDIRKMAIMGRMCTVDKDGNIIECTVPQDKQVAEGRLTSSSKLELETTFS